MQNKVLIIDDEVNLCGLLARIIALEGFTVYQAHTGREGLNILRSEQVPVIISDVRLPDISGVELVREIKLAHPAAEVISLTAFGTIPDGVQAMRNGAFDYIIKGDDNDKIIPLIHQAFAKYKSAASQLPPAVTRGFDSVTGNAPLIREAVRLAQKVAPAQTTVLLLGETGTGKEVFAQAIHEASPRHAQPFIIVNCSSFNANLLESELFGYKAGAFTGALKDKKGLLDAAAGGTLFLDEIGEMNPDLQAKLLRVLENQTYMRVGDTRTQKADIRVIAATNRDLQQEAAQGRFRADLYYRLSVFTIRLPSLGERRQDIPLLAAQFLSSFAAASGKPAFQPDEKFIELLCAYPWKGNIRELKNMMERVVILSDHPVLSADLLPYEFQGAAVPDTSMRIQDIEKTHISKILQHTGGNKTEAARLLGIGLTTLYRKLEEYRIR